MSRREDAQQRRPLSRGEQTRAPSSGPGHGLCTALDKPLPPLPLSARRHGDASSQASLDRSSVSADSLSQSSALTSDPDTTPSPSFAVPGADAARRRPNLAAHASASPLKTLQAPEIVFERLLVPDDARSSSVFYLDVSPTSTVLASKHGKNLIKLCNIDDGTVQATIKFLAYTEAQSRSRDYLIRSHSILSETWALMAIATRFGATIEIWNWERKARLQTIEHADRWAAGGIEVYGDACRPLAVYRAAAHVIDFYVVTRQRKPLAKKRPIRLGQAGLPFLPLYPELALSTTSPLLVMAAGPRPPRAGHPPPDKETLLVAWEMNSDGAVSDKPFRVARPWQHEETVTAIPYELSTYGSIVVSIWIPAGFRTVAVPPSRGGVGFNLIPASVSSRHVLVWDLSANSTRSFAIPNCTSCISPDCRYVAYCHTRGAEYGARGCLSILDVVDGTEVWSWPDKDALAINSGPKPGFEQFNDLARVTELAFSADGRYLVVGDKDGRLGIYSIRE